jgi:glutamyl-tRNA reductase
LRELFELDPTAVDAVATAGELPLVPSDFDPNSDSSE